MKGNNMEAWKQFELDCTDHLNQVFGYKAQFIHQGFEDSTVADIKCVTKSGKTFYLEAKQCPAQCNQFVLLPDVATQTFEYSKQNSLPINDYSKKIINHMNNDFEDFKEAGTSGKDIIFDNCEDVFFDWVKKAYEKKDVEYFITNNYRIFKLNEIADNFNITAKYRVKRSGSTHVGSARMNGVKKYIADNFGITDTRTDGKKLFARTNRDIDKVRFNYDIYEYMFSKRGNEFEIRQLSNTFNANVIFSVSIKYPGTDMGSKFADVLI